MLACIQAFAQSRAGGQSLPHPLSQTVGEEGRSNIGLPEFEKELFDDDIEKVPTVAALAAHSLRLMTYETRTRSGRRRARYPVVQMSRKRVG